jgi:2-amino-4-hydroxy-6-hydroxymethyldihydropteridine diphosphokinase
VAPETVFLGLGTNLGDRRANLGAACAALQTHVQPLTCSAIYETPPWGYTDQPAFLNQVVQGQTTLAPLELLAFLKQIETSIGRTPSFRYGPRLIDLDILYYGDQVLDLPCLSIPHPRLAERAFMLVPLAEIAPTLRHPRSGLTSLQMLAQVDSAGVIRLD